VRTTKKVLATAVGIVCAAIGTAASAGTFMHPLHMSDAQRQLYATENFGPGPIIPADYFRLPAPDGQRYQVTLTTTIGESGGYVVNNGGAVYINWTLSGASLTQAAVAGDFVLGGVPGFLGWTIVSVSTSGDGTQVKLLVQNNTGAAQPIGSGATVQWKLGGLPLRPTNAFGTPGTDQVLVSASINEVVDNTFIDGASGYPIVATADAIRHPQEIVPNAAPRKIAVDPYSQRKMFTGPSVYNNLGRIIWENISGTQFQVNGATDYTITSPAGRTMSATVTAGTGSFNAGTLFLSNSPDCSQGGFANFSYNVGKTVATVSGISAAAAAADPWVCYVVNGPPDGPQINEVTGISATSTLFGPAGLNDIDRVISGSLASILNDGTVIDTRIYIPASANQFGYGMSLRIINTGVTGPADVYAQYIYNDGTLSTQGKIATAVAQDGYVMLENTAIEAAIGAPNAAKGPNPRVRIMASSSSLRVQTYLRTNGIWTEVSGGQGNNTPQYLDPNRLTTNNPWVIPAGTNQ
jgi:hypothetical protein